MNRSLTLSDEQNDIVLTVNNRISSYVNAVPGAGKTTVSLYVSKYSTDCQLLLLTFSSDLKTDARLKKAKLKINNLDIHSYNSFPRPFYDKEAIQDEDIYNIIKNDLPPFKMKKYDIIILDETQDMTDLHYKFIQKFIKDMGSIPTFLIIGDDKQSVFKFKGADSRFLTLSPEIFPVEFKELKLTMSFRLTNEMSKFMNEIILNEDRIKTCKSGYKVSYKIVDIFTPFFLEIIFRKIKHFINKKGYTYEDIFILAPSVTSPSSPINKLNAYLANKKINGEKILIYHPTGDDGSLNEEHMRGKITMTTYHRAKGRERKLVIVLGCDISYYKYYSEICESKDECVEPIYVALTRATEKLILIHHYNEQQLPFIKIKLSDLGKKEYCNLKNYTNCDIDNIPDYPNKNRGKDFTVTQITRYLNQTIELKLIPLLNKVFTQTQSALENIPIKNDIINDTVIENVSDLNGVAIPAMWEYKIHNKISLFGRYKDEIKYRAKNKCHVSKLLRKALDKIENPCSTTEEFLMLANVGKTLDLGIESNLNQIINYDWLQDHVIERSFKRLEDFIKGDNMQFEVSLSRIFNHNDNDIIIRGSIDLLTENSVYELKCVDSLNISHKIQLVFYAWMYKKEFNENRKFYLFNIKTSEAFELDITNPIIDEIIDIIIYDKLYIRTIMTDEEFIRKCKEPVQITDIINISEDRNLSPIEREYLIIDTDDED